MSDEVGADVADQGLQGLDQRPVGLQGAVGEVEEARRGGERRGGGLGLGAADFAQGFGRQLAAGGAVGGDGEADAGAEAVPGEQAAEGEDLGVVGMGAEEQDVHGAAAGCRNSSTMAAVQVKRPPPSGSPVSGS